VHDLQCQRIGVIAVIVASIRCKLMWQATHLGVYVSAFNQHSGSLEAPGS
jgi:hypothetical protein